MSDAFSIRNHVIVDGSNIATEGRTLPNLTQLDEAVRAFLEEHPGTRITAVVDATFGHRIDAGEKARYEQAVLDGDLVAPPAGAIGRGDAFVLAIANKASATVLSNDSFQEFHGDYPWLFDEGRLIGGKPVDGVGWVFVARVPVRGPASRRSSRGTGAKTTKAAKAAKVAKVAKAAKATKPRSDKTSAHAAEAVAAEVAARRAATLPAKATRSRTRRRERRNDPRRDVDTRRWSDDDGNRSASPHRDERTNRGERARSLLGLRGQSSRGK